MRLIILIVVLSAMCGVSVSAAQERPLILVHGFLTLALGPNACIALANETKLGSMFELQSSFVQDGLYSQGWILNEDTISCPPVDSKPTVVRFTFYSGCYEEKNAFETYTNRFEKTIKHLKECTGANKVDIVAHSFGGLVVRNYIRTRNSSDIEKIVFLTTPQAGIGVFPIALVMPSCLLNWIPFCPSEVLEARRTSDFMKKLNNQEKLKQTIYTIKSSFEFFFPKSSPDAINSKESASVSCYHDDIFRPHSCPEGYEKIKEYLED
ncbi:MAG: hypothetical protein AABX51_00555 [Nanoarchaeota archaeon]